MPLLRLTSRSGQEYCVKSPLARETGVKNHASDRLSSLRRAIAQPSAGPSRYRVPDMPSIVVVPLQSMSADGMVEDIITGLFPYPPALRDRPQFEAHLHGQAVDVKRVGRELGMRCVEQTIINQHGRGFRSRCNLGKTVLNRCDLSRRHCNSPRSRMRTCWSWQLKIGAVTGVRFARRRRRHTDRCRSRRSSRPMRGRPPPVQSPPAIPAVQSGKVEAYPNVQLELCGDDNFIDIVEEGFDAEIRMARSVPMGMIAVPLTPRIRFAVVA